MTTVYSIIGEHREDPARVMVLGSDSQYYAMILPSRVTFSVEPDYDWCLDEVQPGTEGVLLESPPL